MQRGRRPFAELAPEEQFVPEQKKSKIIALIDDVLVSGTYGDELVHFFTEKNPDAKILSIRALGNDGFWK